MDNELTHHKRSLILQYIGPELGVNIPDDEGIIKELTTHCRLHHFMKLQLLEVPGEWQDGCIWFSIDAMSHCYYTGPQKGMSCGRQIWKKQEFIFDSYSFYEQQPRSDYIQAVEPGTFISISFPILHWLQDRFPVIKERLIQLSRAQQVYYRNHLQLLNSPPAQRVKLFVVSHPLFARVANNLINGMHVGLSRQTFEHQVRKLKR